MKEEVKKRIKLNNGESIKSKGSRTKGFMGETDIYSYEIVDSNNEVVGTAEHTHHTAVKGFKVSQSLTQKDNAGNTIVEERW
ncbi:hypothetical protein KO528_13545 [Saccharophagus degradans]|uniref:hypothetical protein n=1 Tax=Saccharophagus degradans TaxID=86304 RepID=UPI001C0A3C33|nr:hypothetical protein [Saccharophagus degradans]MBU2986380.1 hypothetical protein [Saccharophagus degradans]